MDVQSRLKSDGPIVYGMGDDGIIYRSKVRGFSAPYGGRGLISGAWVAETLREYHEISPRADVGLSGFVPSVEVVGQPWQFGMTNRISDVNGMVAWAKDAFHLGDGIDSCSSVDLVEIPDEARSFRTKLKKSGGEGYDEFLNWFADVEEALWTDAKKATKFVNLYGDGSVLEANWQVMQDKHLELAAKEVRSYIRKNQMVIESRRVW